MTDQLTEQIKVVAKARQASTVAIDARAIARRQWETEHADLEFYVLETHKLKEAEEAKLREMTIAIFNATGNKAPAPGVGIREGMELQYIKDEALEWAVVHKIALSLDKTAFEKIVKASPATFDFVQLIPTVTATIAQNLAVEEKVKEVERK